MCEKLCEKKVIIVAAFDNQDVMSYPAAFKCVIGIDGVIARLKQGEYISIKDHVVDYIGEIREQYVPWLNGAKNRVSGTSFLAPLFTARVANILKERKLDIFEVKQLLDKNSVMIYRNEQYKPKKIDFKIKKCIA